MKSSEEGVKKIKIRRRLFHTFGLTIKLAPPTFHMPSGLVLLAFNI